MREKKTNYLLFIEYKGTKFYGWQKQPSKRTVQQEIEKAAQKVLGETIEPVGASRTDSGVHAKHQIVNLLASRHIPPIRLMLALNGVLPSDISVFKIRTVKKGVLARHISKEKTYEYRIWNKPHRPAIEEEFVWHIPGKLDVEAIRAASRPLIGRHDFTSFCAVKGTQKNKTVDLREISVRKRANEVVMRFTADRFLCHMIRNIVGTLIEAGKRKIGAEDIKRILDKKDRACAGMAAPANGLTLKNITLGTIE
jgi:tRNA pseudouridine38-40 synthase